METIILPGEAISVTSHDARFGNGFIEISPGVAIATVAGKLELRSKAIKPENQEVKPDGETQTHIKKLAIKSLRSIYFPQPGENVIGIIVKKGPESYGVDINSGQPAFLDSVEFNGATKRNKPNLKVGDAIFTKVESVNKFMAPVLTCKSKHCKKDWTSGESTYGQLKDGIVHTLTAGLNEYLRQEKTLFAEIKKYVAFEVALGANDR